MGWHHIKILKTLSNISNKRIIKNTAYLYIRMVVVMVMNLYTSRLVLDALGVDDYGLYTVVGGIVLLFAIINNALGSGTSRYITFELGRGDFNRLRNTFSASFQIHLCVALLVFLLAETLGLWYVNTILVVSPDRIVAANWVYQFSIVTCLISLTQVPYSACIIAHEDMSVYAWVGIAEASFKLLMALYVLYCASSDKLILYGLIMMCWNICIQGYYRYYCGKHYKESLLMRVQDKDIFKSMISFSFWDVMGAFTVNGYSQGVNMLINFFFSLSVNAAKGISYQVQHVIEMFCNNFMTAVKPQIVKLFAEGDVAKMKKLICESSKISFFLLLMVVLPLCLEADFVLNLWLKVVPEKTSLFLVLILIFSLMRAFARPIVVGVHASGNIKQLNLYSGGTSIALNLPLTYAAYLMGAPAEATFYILLISTVICNYIELYCLKKEIGFDILHYTIFVYLRCVLIVIPAILAGIAVTLYFQPSFLRLVATTVVTISLICLFAFVFGLSQGTKNEITAIIKSKLVIK